MRDPDHPAPPDEYEVCPDCGAHVDTWVEEIEYGRPLNAHHKPVAEAPRYRTKPVRFFQCSKDCGWYVP